MRIKTVVTGTVMKKDLTKKGKQLIKVFDGDELITVYGDEFNVEIGESIDIPVMISAENCFISKINE